MNSFIITFDGVAGIENGRPFTADITHRNYDAIICALRNKEFDRIRNLVNISHTIAEFTNSTNGRIEVDVDAGDVLFQGMVIHNVLTDRIIQMLDDGFDINPMVKLLDNMLENPSRAAIPRLYEWMEAGKLPITEDGCFIAYKRVSDDLTSFHDRRTLHVIGATTTMPRSDCDEDQTRCCSTGLHFCSQGYLPSYNGGMGRILVLKINPRDVVAIPVEYGTHKGRCCAYTVIAELTDDYRERVETENPLTQSVVTADTDYSGDVTVDNDNDNEYVEGYLVGHTDGRDGYYQVNDDLMEDYEYATDLHNITHHCAQGYLAGHKDGRGHKRKLYN